MLNKLKRLLEGRKETYIEKTPEDVYREVAENSEHFSPEDISQLGGLESQHGKYEKPFAGGSARGLFQFQPATAEDLVPGSSENLNDRNVQSELMSKYLEQNNQETPESAFTMHNLGPGRGKIFLDAPDHELVKNVIPARVIRANPSLYNVKTVGEARDIIKKRLQAGGESANLQPNILDLFKEK